MKAERRLGLCHPSAASARLFSCGAHPSSLLGNISCHSLKMKISTGRQKWRCESIGVFFWREKKVSPIHGYFSNNFKGKNIIDVIPP